jgi:hypothetical protein
MTEDNNQRLLRVNYCQQHIIYHLLPPTDHVSVLKYLQQPLKVEEGGESWVVDRCWWKVIMILDCQKTMNYWQLLVTNVPSQIS